MDNMENVNFKAYKDKRILITGHTGFKGAWLALWLHKLGAKIIGYSLPPPTQPNLFEAIQLEKDIIHVTGDVRDKEALEKAFKEHNPEIVFHLAAQPLVRYSHQDPRYTYETNVLGTLNVLEAVKKTPSVKVFINITTDKCYENKEVLYGYKETDPLGGNDPYSSSKACSEIITHAYRHSFFNPEQYGSKHNVAIATVRAGNVIGGGDWAEDRLVPDCVKALSQNKTIILRNPKAIRPWQFILEPLSGYLCLGAHLLQNGANFSQAWNFGPDESDAVPVETVVKSAIQHWGSGEYTITPDLNIKEAKLLTLNAQKAQTQLGWKPVYKFNDAIKHTLNWYKKYYTNKSGLREQCLQDINDYTETAKKQNLPWSAE